MIRQAISCDICGTEKKQTNHWFVAYEQTGELRVSGWNSRNRTRPGSKHLCGQTCLHKLVDDFMARTIVKGQGHVAVGAAETVAAEAGTRPVPTDTSLTVQESFEEIESSARLITPPEPATPSHRPAASLVQMPGRHVTDDLLELEDSSRSSRDWRSEAWEREREREMRAVERLRPAR
ncbi:MAG: hypothetical protein P4K83_06975 [Terracidiphilus sp.]|nr:hypothetical protein [Terracidiphilus sp.]